MIIRLCHLCHSTHIECEGLKLECGMLRGPMGSRKASRGDRAMLRRFLSGPSHEVVTVPELIEWMWGEHSDGGPLPAEGAVRVYVYRLRQCLAEIGSPLRITVIGKRGYSLIHTQAQKDAA